jgi:thiosulfate/3-mercaptopyruvate sulfurtransferase
MSDDFPTPIVSGEWLAAHLGAPDIRILDATILISPPSSPGEGWRVSNNREAHDAWHLPGSHYADLLSEFSNPVGRFPRPDGARFTAAVQSLGIEPETRLVIYDRSSGVWAARLWWVMRSFGLDRASVLDGGFGLWEAQGRPTTAAPSSQPVPSTFVTRDRPELFAGRDDVLAVVEQGGACLINALDTSDFVATETLGYARPGRIPGSLSVPASGLLDPADGRYLSEALLRRRFASVLARPGRKVVYCGGGIAACADALALTLLGERDVGVYDASLEEWAADPSLPMEVEAAA